MMHIIYLVHHFPAIGLSCGGAGNYVANMARIMVEHGHKVTVIVEGIEKKTVEWNGITICQIPAARGFKDTGRTMPVYKKFLKNLCRSYNYNREVKRINKIYPVDIVQSVNSYGLALLRNRRIPYVVRISDYPSLWSGANREKYDMSASLKTRRFDEEVQFIALKRADELIAPSTLMCRLIKEKIGKSVSLVESPVLVDEELTRQYKEAELEGKNYFLTFGAMNYRKSILMLSEIIHEILEKYPNMLYVMVGKDREVFYQNKYILVSEMLESHIKKNNDRFIFMNEMTDRHRLFSIIKNAYICILPTRIDNLPNTCLEAMALGKIVISSKETSVEQLITDGYNGFLAEIDNAEELMNKIDTVMAMKESEKYLIENRAKERVKGLTGENVYWKMKEIYDKVIKEYALGSREIGRN